jgi:hypothetical protein
VDHEADILLDLARVRWNEAQTFEVSETSKVSQRREEAQRLAEEALTITERSGYVLQGADVHLFLAETEIERGDRERAMAHAREARLVGKRGCRRQQCGRWRTRGRRDGWRRAMAPPTTRTRSRTTRRARCWRG